jgi:hypothetical protein
LYTKVSISTHSYLQLFQLENDTYHNALGLVTSVFFNDDREVIVGQGSDYYDELNCSNIAVGGKCKVSVSAYVDAFFGGHYSRDNVARMISF